MNVLAVDPGGNTGIAQYVNEEWKAWIEPFDQAQMTVHRLLESGVPKITKEGLHQPHFDLVVFESIVITAATLKKSRDVMKSIEFIGVGRYLCKCYGIEFITQTPSEGMSFGTDTKLRAMGWFTPGPDHANSASKHLLLALVNRRLIDVAALARKLG